MITLIDNFLNKITMYRLTLYSLIVMALGGLMLSFLKILPYNPFYFILGAVFIVLICYLSNILFAKVFKAIPNVESVYITAFILILIVTPIINLSDLLYWGFLFWVSLFAMASKYIIAIGKKHIFNPTAFSVALMALTINQSAGWWIGTMAMAPIVIICGLLITRKLQRFDLVMTFLVVALLSIVGLRAQGLNSGILLASHSLLYSPLLFFSFIMLTEPMTAPQAKGKRIFYAAIVGLLFSPTIHLFSLYSTPELALLVGNIFAYIVSPKQRLVLRLKKKVQIANSTYDFVFNADEKLNFYPGQYLEWTLGHRNSDSRGNRRYFTVASSPTEEQEIRIGVKFYPNGSSFKENLLNMEEGDTIIASQLAGEFILPKEKQKKLVFLAGGIGITPFRSMIKSMLDKKEKRDAILLYSNLTKQDIAYGDIIKQAENEIGLKTIYTLTGNILPQENWKGGVGFINEKMIKEKVPDYLDRHYYISGTHGMVVAFEKLLYDIGVPKRQIKIDFFPGFA
ncbi:MAG: FAD-binding oxidoreductase [Candidatus Paceibacterota bacterium]